MKKIAVVSLLALIIAGMVSAEETGTLRIVNTGADRIVDVLAPDGTFQVPSSPGIYRLPPGDYGIRARLIDDIAWTWTRTASIESGTEVHLSLPDTMEHSVFWQLHTEQSRLVDLQVRLDSRDSFRANMETGFLVTGIVCTGASVLLYWLGSQAMSDYRNSTDSGTITALRSQLEMYSAGFWTSAIAGGISLGGSLILLAPDKDALQAKKQVDECLRSISSLKNKGAY